VGFRARTGILSLAVSHLDELNLFVRLYFALEVDHAKLARTVGGGRARRRIEAVDLGLGLRNDGWLFTHDRTGLRAIQHVGAQISDQVVFVVFIRHWHQRYIRAISNSKQTICITITTTNSNSNYNCFYFCLKY